MPFRVRAEYRGVHPVFLVLTLKISDSHLTQIAVAVAKRLGTTRLLRPRLPQLLNSFDVEGVASLLKEGVCQKIVVLCGAGFSFSKT